MSTLECILIIILYIVMGIFAYIKQEILVHQDKEDLSPVGAFFFWPLVLLARAIKKVIVDPWD